MTIIWEDKAQNYIFTTTIVVAAGTPRARARTAAECEWAGALLASPVTYCSLLSALDA